jgi:hypothetical protein
MDEDDGLALLSERLGGVLEALRACWLFLSMSMHTATSG